MPQKILNYIERFTGIDQNGRAPVPEIVGMDDPSARHAASTMRHVAWRLKGCPSYRLLYATNSGSVSAALSVNRDLGDFQSPQQATGFSRQLLTLELNRY
jgi:hypothetical protein